MKDRRAQRAAVAAVLSAITAPLLFVGCGEESTAPYPGNRPPATYLSIQSSFTDTLSNQEPIRGYRHILTWWGADPDGFIQGYLIQWDGPWSEAHRDSCLELEGACWIFTAATEDTFIVPLDGTPGIPNDTTFAIRTFRVRAVDDRGLADPVGRSQTFQLRNWTPEIRWSGDLALPVRSLPAVSFSWAAGDLDGRQTVTHFEYWLDGYDSTRVLVTPDTVVALTPNDFEEDGQPIYGTRTVYVRAVDEAGTPSNTISHSWIVEEPQGRFLLIDDAPSTLPGSERNEDPFFSAMLDSVAPGDWFLYDVEERGRFQTAEEVGPLFSLFDGVVWYSGVSQSENDSNVLRNLSMAEPGLRGYLEAGGRVIVAATNAIGDSAGLSPSFAEELLGVSGFYRRDGSHNLGLPTRSSVYTALGGTLDSLQTTSTSVNADFPILATDVSIPFHVAGAALGPGIEPQPLDLVPAAVLSERAGRIAVMPFLLSRANGYLNRDRLGAVFFRQVLSN